jgi:polysaccharide pyruvyl transferase WcaK-like protein
MKQKPIVRRIDESDPDSYRRYKKWAASRAYNERCVPDVVWNLRSKVTHTTNSNREARNAKKRDRMAALRAKQKSDPPTVQAARLAAKEASARKYREKYVQFLFLPVARTKIVTETEVPLLSKRLSHVIALARHAGW